MSGLFLHITGASGAGVSTLGRDLSRRLRLPQIDCDDYYWLPVDPPFSVKRAESDRVRLIRETMKPSGWILTGSCAGWGDAFRPDFTHVIRVETATPVRLERLQQRQEQRFGDRVREGGDMYDAHKAFLNWASGYDDPEFAGRNRAMHQNWLDALKAPVLTVNGEQPVETLVDEVLGWLQRSPNAALS